jgi:peptidoglycan hydrolase-like protein with peptidoglycan-binding domain
MRRIWVLGAVAIVVAVGAAGAYAASHRGSGRSAAAPPVSRHHPSGPLHIRRSMLASHHHVRLRPPHGYGHRNPVYPILSDGSVGPAVRRLQQLLAREGYLPMAFVATGPPPLYPFAPRSGQFQMRYTSMPGLATQWQAGTYGTITRGAVMSFQSQHHMAIDGDAGPWVWRALLHDAAHPPGHAYVNVVVRETSPETITVYRDGRPVFSSPANTGIPQAPTALGTYPVYLRYTSTTMSGTNPDGTHYSDPGVPWVSYFNGGDAVHGFLRSSYGSPQSLGCVELPYSAAQTAYGLMDYGTLVTVTS